MFPLERCSGLLERTPTSVELQDIKQQVQAALRKAENETGFESFEVPGLIKFACAKQLNDERLEKWASIRDMKVAQLGMVGPNVDEFIRIARKLREKMEQVPADRANVVVLYSHMFAMPPRNAIEFAAYAAALERIVHRHTHIGFFILIFNWTGGNDNTVIQHGDHICVNRLWLHFNCSSMMLIKNRFAAKPMEPAAEKAFLEAFMQSSK